MSLSRNLAAKFNHFLTSFDSIIEEVIRRALALNKNLPALSICLNNGDSVRATNNNFDLKNLLENSIVWYCPVPKKRTTAESKLTKKFLALPNNFITKYANPKTNIIACLDCGDYHEQGTICRKCYQKVKTETENIHEQMFKTEKFKYNYPPKEIALMYQDEQSAKEAIEAKNKVVVEIPRNRPSWFNSDLLKKVTTK